jgi:hypothetical protein
LSASSTSSTSATLTSPTLPHGSDDEPESLAIAPPPPQTPRLQSLDDSNNSASQGVKTRSQCARDASLP